MATIESFEAAVKKDFKNVGHFVASTAQKFVAFAAKAPVLLQKAEAEKPLVDAVATVLGPQAVVLENIVYAVFGAGVHDAIAGGTLIKDLFAKVGTPQLISDFEGAVTTLKQNPVSL